ncbi:MAG TPA: hypothetical protein VH061_03175 [Solirubrobacteraceae bacterium]|jgi:hypothetical protein|nr:hypothetical protein [Solirubrobacteraceae bacterium]
MRTKFGWRWAVFVSLVLLGTGLYVRGEKFHAAGPTEGGFLIVGVQDSKDAAESFLHNTLMPLMPIEGGLVGPPEERSAEIVNSEGLSE